MRLGHGRARLGVVGVVEGKVMLGLGKVRRGEEVKL